MAGQAFFERTQYVYRAPTTRTGDALFTGDEINCERHLGVRFTIDISAQSSIAQTYVIEYKDPIGGDWVSLLESASKTGAGTFTLTVGPGVATASNVSVQTYVPAVIRLVVKSGSTATSVTDSVYVELFGV